MIEKLENEIKNPQKNHVGDNISSGISTYKSSYSRRPILTVGIALMLFPSFLILLSLTSRGSFELTPFYQIFVITLIAIGLILIVFDELFVKNKSSSVLTSAMQRKINRIEDELRAEKNRNLNENISNEEYEKLFSELKNEVKNNLSSDILDSLRVKVNTNDELEYIQKANYQFRERVEREIKQLSSRANVNLLIGSATTIFGVSILAYMLLDGGFVYNAESSITNNKLLDYVLYYIPRLSVVLFIEVFSYFFLRLYRANLSDMKYFQNELTNIESKLTALNIAVHSQDDSLKSVVVNGFITTERNFVLKKGETTIDLEVSKMEAAKSAETTKILQSALKETRTLFKSRK